MSELWDLIDNNGQQSGIVWQRDKRDEIPEGLYIPCVEVWVRIADRLLITQRHPSKREGLKYEVSGGGVLLGENFSSAAARELYEEVGISADPNSLTLLGSDKIGDVFAFSYLLKLDSLPEIVLQPNEVVAYRLVTEKELIEMTDLLTKGTYKRFVAYKDKLFH